MTMPLTSTDKDKMDSQKGFLLFNRRPVISESVFELLDEAEAITGINKGEIRMRLTGQGIGAFNINRPYNELETCASDLQSIGINAVVVSRQLIRNSRLPTTAKHLWYDSSSLRFYDTADNVIFEITPDTDLLVIVTDLSGKSVKQMLTAMAYTGNAIEKKFEDILKKISLSKPAVIF